MSFYDGKARRLQQLVRQHDGRIPEGHYLAFGQNTGTSEDSALFGLVSAEQVVGTAALLPGDRR